MAGALLCAAYAPGWVSFSGARFGAQLSTIREQLHGQASSLPPMQELGYLWSMPSDSLSSAGLGGGLGERLPPAPGGGQILAQKQGPGAHCPAPGGSPSMASTAWSVRL